ncbi:hypothetical protein BZARG_763 [Bizionia argentinensis JUB59]|uniref:Uncharacterized protein n=1 Tax=Bizionia argentinensis JUB59 TaxID=1046627 RepID=G2EB80_9FLAO|nr:hypothetical protein [Bizionia argentinensis]EGV44468.1 hypothetical protein BZARG_763 [Bizionia argentinensis JUB59]
MTHEQTFTVLLTKNPPPGTWCFDMIGRTFQVVDRGDWYLLIKDINAPSNKKRCLVKSFVSILK